LEVEFEFIVFGIKHQTARVYAIVSLFVHQNWNFWTVYATQKTGRSVGPSPIPRKFPANTGYWTGIAKITTPPLSDYIGTRVTSTTSAGIHPECRCKAGHLHKSMWTYRTRSTRTTLAASLTPCGVQDTTPVFKALNGWHLHTWSMIATWLAMTFADYVQLFPSHVWYQ